MYNFVSWATALKHQIKVMNPFTTKHILQDDPEGLAGGQIPPFTIGEKPENDKTSKPADNSKLLSKHY